MVEGVEITVPPCLGLIGEEIRINDIVSSSFSSEVRSIHVRFPEDILLNTCIVSSVIAVRPLGDLRVNNWNVVSLLLLIIFDEVFQVGEIYVIDGESFAFVHVVNIVPDGFERKVVFLVLVDHDFHDKFVVEAEASLTPSEGPEWWQNWPADQSMVSANNFVWISSEQDRDVDAAAISESGDIDSALCLIILNQPVLSCCKICVYSEPGLVRGLSHVEWVNIIR